MTGSEDMPETGCGFACLHRTDRGRIFHCGAFRRVVIEFAGAHLILRPWEFRRLKEHLGRLAVCRFTRSRILGGERVRLRDATGDRALILDLEGLQDFVDLMETGANRLDGLGESTERPRLPYQSAFINNAIAGRAFQAMREKGP